MSYTKAFKQLHSLAVQSNGTVSCIQYKLVAIYLGRVMMAETAVERTGKVNLNSPVTTSMDWVNSMKGHKEIMIEHFLNINSYEWKLIRKGMMEYADRSRGSESWIWKRKGWVIELETLRAFHQK